MPMRRIATCLIFFATTLNAATAQSFNLDYGVAFGGPSSSYGGVPGQPGYWNVLPDAEQPSQSLLDLNGSPTGVTISQSLPFGEAWFDHPGPVGDDKALLDDYLDLHSTPHTFVISGLAAGNYSIYTYAWAPDNPDFKTAVDVNEVGAQVIGGVWSGSQQLGVTYARHDVDVARGGNVNLFTFGFTKGTLNGLQIVANSKNPCTADIAPKRGDGEVNVDDLLLLINSWGANTGAADIDPPGGNSHVDVDDLLALINAWGPCS